MGIRMKEGGTEAFVVLVGGRLEYNKEMQIRNEYPQQRLIKYRPGSGCPLEKDSFSTHLNKPLLQ